MARTRNATVHAVRRDAFIDAAQRLIQVKGYEQMKASYQQATQMRLPT